MCREFLKAVLYYNSFSLINAAVWHFMQHRKSTVSDLESIPTFSPTTIFEI